MNRVHPAQVIGNLASRRVRQPGYEGRVLACLREAVYFQEPGGSLLWLALPNHPPHRRAILAEFDPLQARVGASVRVRGGSLILEGLPAIGLSQATCWSAPPVERHRLQAWDSLRDHLSAFVADVAALPSRRGFGHLIGLPLGDVPGVDSRDLDLRRWETIFSPAGALLRAGQAEGLAGVIGSAGELIGLGPGLTPAGDDFVGGLLFAVQHLGRAYPRHVHRDPARRKAFLERSRSATSQISHMVLCDLAHGHGPEPIHALLQALLHGDEPLRARSALDAMANIGHTSGWDMLAGALSGVSLVCGRGSL